MSLFNARFAHRRFIVGVGTAAMACVLVASTAISAGASAHKTQSHASSTAKPDFAYFRGKTITMYSFGSAGSSSDLTIRVIAPYVGAYLHATVIVQDVASTTSLIVGQNIPASMPPNGLSIGELDTLADILLFVTNTPGLTFNLRSLLYLPSQPASALTLVTTPSSGFTSFKQIVDASSPMIDLQIANSSSGLQAQLLFGAYHAAVKFVYGYPSAAAVLQGFIRGDGQASLEAVATVIPDILGHQAVPVLQSAPPTKGSNGYALMRAVPTLAKFAVSDPPKTKDGKAELAELQRLASLGSIYFSPVGTPAKYQSALAAALTWAETRGGAQAQDVQEGIRPGSVAGSVFRTQIIAAIKAQPELEKWLTSTISG